MKWYEIPWLQWTCLWLLLVMVPLASRTFLQIDETRYVTVAWEMWLSGEWLVPILNGEVYHHKPPLLFWLIMIGWTIFGVNEWWPRLVPGFFSLGSLWLCVYLAGLLWPQLPAIARLTPFILLACLPWSLFTSAMMFDMMLAFFTLLGMVALVSAWRTTKHNNWQNYFAWGLFSVAIGLGTLTKGPVILLHLLPVAILAPWWQQMSFSSAWYLRLTISVILGVLIALAWAIPAGLAGGEAFRQAIFWGQTANRLVNSFAHEHPFWWYLPLLPVFLFPWFFWLPSWHGFKQLPDLLHDSGVRFNLTWFIVVFFSFSLVSGKQLHYLLPILPAFALLTAYLLVTIPQASSNSRWDTVLLGLIIFSIGGILLLISLWSSLFSFTEKLSWSSNISSLPGVVLLVISIILIGKSWLRQSSTVLSVSIAAVLFSLILPLTIIQAAGKAYDLHEISQQMDRLQKNQQTIVHFGDYHGQYQFLGRLQQPLPVIDEYTICPWLTENSDGKLVIYLTKNYQALKQQADYVQAYRSQEVAIIDSQFLLSACVKVMPLL
jgi:4-amino-4-deoxy-L-arabinose transferase-like glycosyltransferase